MASPKQPQDRKPKSGDDEPESFSFDYDGETYTFAPTKSVLNPGFVRRFRHADEGDIIFTLIEKLTDEDTLEVLDGMEFSENADVMGKFGDHIKALMGAGLGK